MYWKHILHGRLRRCFPHNQPHSCFHTSTIKHSTVYRQYICTMYIKKKCSEIISIYEWINLYVQRLSPVCLHIHACIHKRIRGLASGWFEWTFHKRRISYSGDKYTYVKKIQKWLHSTTNAEHHSFRCNLWRRQEQRFPVVGKQYYSENNSNW